MYMHHPLYETHCVRTMYINFIHCNIKYILSQCITLKYFSWTTFPTKIKCEIFCVIYVNLYQFWLLKLKVWWWNLNYAKIYKPNILLAKISQSMVIHICPCTCTQCTHVYVYMCMYVCIHVGYCMWEYHWLEESDCWRYRTGTHTSCPLHNRWCIPLRWGRTG